MATNKEPLLARPREGERAGPAVQTIRETRVASSRQGLIQVVKFLLDRGTSGHQCRGVAQPGLARLPWEQEVGSSNLLAPTILINGLRERRCSRADRLRKSRRVTLRGITSNSLSRPRDGERAGPAVQICSPRPSLAMSVINNED